MRSPQPKKRYREVKPTKQTVYLGGHAVNLLALSADLGLDHGYLSRVCRAERIPSIPYAQKVADALGWSIQQFLDAITVRATADTD